MSRILQIDCTGNYKEIKYVRGVREAGGLGDVVRCISVFQGLKLKYPEARIHFYGPKFLQQLIASRCPSIDLYIPINRHIKDNVYIQRRKGTLREDLLPHLQRNIKYEESINLFCTAYDHESETEGLVCQERTELWCQEANVQVTRPRLFPLKQDLQVANNYKKMNSRIVGIQVGATCKSREWPFEYWDSLIKLLLKEGIKVILFDVFRRWKESIDTSKVEVCINGSWFDVCGKILATDLMITPDSGFYHLAGALRAKTLGIFGSTSGQVISRVWNLEENTHHYLQLPDSKIDMSLLPKSNKSGRPCNPICNMRWSRGWDEDRYRKDGDYCAIIKQITPKVVFHRVMDLL